MPGEIPADVPDGILIGILPEDGAVTDLDDCKHQAVGADGNLLVDSWELLFLGMIGSDPFADGDGDGYSHLQEMFEGTDPMDGAGIPVVPITAVEAPVLILETSAGWDVYLEWAWPDAYADKVQFQVLATPDLGQELMVMPVSPVSMGGGLFSVTLPNGGGSRQFYTVRFYLK